jgi:hypothetical protein
VELVSAAAAELMILASVFVKMVLFLKEKKLKNLVILADIIEINLSKK